ncbi:hypothetical protein FH972_001619 [Carpinus fangiana]|uniref:FAD-binding domain-containing protein n=1 Tax=Carpinus fangiana TaxID=176857 RepID=A0A5N6QFH7_9ROSI|nr:hypothetical protein FH972_001619 [Carpinus fangiana]
MAPHATSFIFSGDKDQFSPERFAAPSSGSPEAQLNAHDASKGDTSNCDGAQKSLPQRHPVTGISVIIAGSGIGGLMAAIECWRKGHTVLKIFERNDAPIYTGDSIGIQPSAMSVFRHWPDMCREIEEEQYDCTISYKKHTGDHVYGPGPPSFNDPENRVGRLGPHVGFLQNRVNFYRTFLRQVAKLGLRIEYGKPVKEYFEDANAKKGGVILENGEVHLADLVIAADGIKTRSGKLVAGKDTSPKESGMAIYRCAYPIDLAFADPNVRQRWQSTNTDTPPSWEFWLGPGMHAAVLIAHGIAHWALTHKDDGSARESWDPKVKPEEVLRQMDVAKGWHPDLLALMRTAPPGSIVHWKLMWRDLRSTWTSPGARVVQIGDSAHSFLPASGNGGTQALEDAVTLATCLQLSGSKDSAPLAAKVFNLLRYQRVSCAQKMSFVNAQLKHQTDWPTIEANPKLIRTRFPRWVYMHDPEDYAYNKYGQAVHHILADGAFKNTNIPPGHKFVPWTIEQVQKDIENGKKVENFLDGDWT